MREEGIGGSGAAIGEVKVDEAKMKEMKLKTQQAMAQHKGWIDKNMQGWPEKTKEVTAMTITKLGPPSVTDKLLVWGEKGSWKMTILHREEADHAFPMPHKDVLQQFVDFKVPPDKFDELAKFDGSVVAERTTGHLSARCDKEEANFLAINLAADVAHGKKTADEARDYYARAVKDMLGGKMAPYLKGLQLEPNRGATADADKARFANPMMPKAMGRNPADR